MTCDVKLSHSSALCCVGLDYTTERVAALGASGRSLISLSVNISSCVSPMQLAGLAMTEDGRVKVLMGILHVLNGPDIFMYSNILIALKTTLLEENTGSQAHPKQINNVS